MAKGEDSAAITKSFSGPTKLKDLSLNPFLHKENVNTMFIQYITFPASVSLVPWSQLFSVCQFLVFIHFFLFPSFSLHLYTFYFSLYFRTQGKVFALPTNTQKKKYEGQFLTSL